MRLDWAMGGDDVGGAGMWKAGGVSGLLLLLHLENWKEIVMGEELDRN